MKCYCCDAEVSRARRAWMREFIPLARGDGPDSPGYKAYCEAATFRPELVCEDCYLRMDSPAGCVVIRGREFCLAGKSRDLRAAVYDAQKLDRLLASQQRRRQPQPVPTSTGGATIRCYCCRVEVTETRRVMLRGDPLGHPASWPTPMPGSPAYEAYRQDTTFRPAFVCGACYQTLDQSALGRAEIAGRWYNISSSSCIGRAPVYDRRKYDQYQRTQARKMGLE